MFSFNNIDKIGRIFFFFLFFLPYNCLLGQNHYDSSSSSKLCIADLNKVFGLDPILYNGTFYNSYYTLNVKGHPYFLTPNFNKGEVIIRGEKFKDIDLNFDTYKQELLLKYTNSSNGSNIILISKTWLESFSIGDNHFVQYGAQEMPKRFYQVIGNDSIQLFIYLKKFLVIDNAAGAYSFSPIQKELYVYMNKSLHRFWNNRSFIHLFALDKQQQIKKFIQSNKIRVNKASDKTMEDLINFCSK